MGIHHFKKTFTYIYGTPPPKQTFFEVATLFGTNYPVQFEFQWGGTIYIYIYTHVCIINCCLTVEPRVLRAILSSKSVCKTFANETGSGFKIQDSRLKIQDSRSKTLDSRFKIQDSRFKKNFLNPETLLILAQGFKKFFLNLESWILSLGSWILNLGSWILNLESWVLNSWILSQSRLQTFANPFGDKIALSTLALYASGPT